MVELAGHTLESKGSIRYCRKKSIQSLYSLKHLSKMTVLKKNGAFFINITIDSVR